MALAIKQFRESLNMSQEQFASIIGVSKVNYCKKENGQVKFSLNEAYKFSNHFKQPIEKIFGCVEFSRDEP
ncbi:MAG: helix-turn-helix domain-containing protein [Eubacterium sp.]|nr:helix-turn-helix domain-containing protein [Eubacterium sp.]